MLGWPPAKLSPNARPHWAELASVKKAYRLACAWQTKEQGAKLARTDRRVLVQLEFFKPNRREIDIDNLVARMKSGLDGVSDALGINDRLFDLDRPLVSDQIGGFVKVRLFEEQ